MANQLGNNTESISPEMKNPLNAAHYSNGGPPLNAPLLEIVQNLQKLESEDLIELTPLIELISQTLQRQLNQEDKSKVIENLMEVAQALKCRETPEEFKLTKCLADVTHALKQDHDPQRAVNAVNRYYRKPTAFIHIPKTGGTYIGQLETNNRPVIYPIRNLVHRCVVENEDSPNPIWLEHRDPSKKRMVVPYADIQNYFLVTAVRNIFDFLISYQGEMAGWNKQYEDKDQVDFEAANQDFEHYLETILNRDAQWPNRHILLFQMFTEQGNFIIDWILHTESLDEDLRELAHFCHLDYCQREKMRVGNREQNYQTYYTESQIGKVYANWGRELALFGHSFEGVNLEKALIKKGAVPGWIKNGLKYHRETDELTLEGTVIPKPYDEAVRVIETFLHRV